MAKATKEATKAVGNASGFDLMGFTVDAPEEETGGNGGGRRGVPHITCNPSHGNSGFSYMYAGELDGLKDVEAYCVVSGVDVEASTVEKVLIVRADTVEENGGVSAFSFPLGSKGAIISGKRIIVSSKMRKYHEAITAKLEGSNKKSLSLTVKEFHFA